MHFHEKDDGTSGCYTRDEDTYNLPSWDKEKGKKANELGEGYKLFYSGVHENTNE